MRKCTLSQGGEEYHTWSKSRETNWIGDILRRNCLLICIIKGKVEGRLEVTGRQGRRRKKILDYLKETRGY